MNQSDANNLWFNYANNYYSYLTGPSAGGPPVKAVKFSLKDGKMLIHFSDGQCVFHNGFQDIMAFAGGDSDFEGTGGYATHGDTIIGEGRAVSGNASMKSDDLDEMLKNIDGGLMSDVELAEMKRKSQATEIPKQKEMETSPVILLVDKAKDLDIDELSINYKLETIPVDLFSVISKAYPESEKEILNYYVSKFENNSSLVGLVKDSLKKYMIDKYKLAEDIFEEKVELVVVEDEVMEGTVSNPKKNQE